MRSKGPRMPIQYEYGFMLHTIDLSHTGDISSESGTALFGQELADLTQGLNESLLQFDGGDWEILSHNISFTGPTAVVSFLIRRRVMTQEKSASKPSGM